MLKGIIVVEPVKPGMDQDEILDAVCLKITGRQGTFKQNQEFMKSVIAEYERIGKSFFDFSDTGNVKVPIIIIQASQRNINEKPADLSGAARILTDSFGLNVLIDSSENAFPDEKTTGREYMIEFEPMSWDMMRSMPEYKELFEMLRQQGNEEVVLAVCGGAPYLLYQLKQKIDKM